MENPKGKLTGKTSWLILDGRAWDDSDKASVYCAYYSGDGDTVESVKKERDEEWPDGVVFEYDELKGDDGQMYIINQRLIG
jgi:hypothetical protein